MGKRKQKLSEGKRNIIANLIEEYDIKSAEDIQEALKDLLGGTIESMLKAELDNHLGYEPYKRTESSNSRNGNKKWLEANMVNLKLMYYKTVKILLSHS